MAEKKNDDRASEPETQHEKRQEADVASGQAPAPDPGGIPPETQHEEKQAARKGD